ncbi:histidine kinase dimerization/phospho-acceptor domain-containing protein [Shewanella surugensis]|uniref:histidine kinase dimerization/phospho-acceptor domain-containing protein n=1 Tax=Shewanella surugensis TaxID=212020 RepID=UPI0040688360
MTHILQAMPSAVVILDANGVISEANSVACQLLEEIASLSTLEPADGREQEQGTIKCRTGTAIPMTAIDDPLVASLVGKSWRQVIKQAFLPKNDDGYEVSLRSGRRVSIAIRPLTPEPGQLIVLTDLTETRQLQKNVSHLQRLSALGKMVATLAHQIRTPLAAAILYAENLSHNNIGSEIRERFQQKLMDRLGGTGASSQ